jgi:hypothetical protein
MIKIKEYKGVPSILIIIAMLIAFTFAWFYPIPINGITLGMFCLTMILALIGMTIIHELLHGIWFKIFAGRVKFGVIMKFKVILYAFYASAPQAKFSRDHFMLIAIFPQVLNIICILVALLNHNLFVDYVAVVVFVMNLLGGVSDLWTVARLSRYDKKVLVEDTKTGMIIYKLSD